MARATPGVARVIGAVSQFVIFERHARKDGFFLIGYEPAAGGGPWRLVEGREPAADDELVIDRTTADQHQIAIGDRIGLLDRDATVVGLSDETTFWAGSIAFARITTLESLLRAPGLRSFLLVTPADGVSPETLRDRLDLPGTEVLLKSEVIANDRRLMARVYDAPSGLMVGIAFFVGVLVVGLVIYAATVERRREYGAVKAIGAPNRTPYRVVITQALIAAAVGAVVGIGLAYSGGAVLMAWRPQFLVAIEPGAVALVGLEIMRLLRRIAKEQRRSVVIVSHDDRVRDIADRVLWLEDGAFKDMVTMATDPVCGMAVERERAVTEDRDGQTYFFCSNGCRAEFLAADSQAGLDPRGVRAHLTTGHLRRRSAPRRLTALQSLSTSRQS